MLAVLATGIKERQAHDLDSRPDLLNCPNCVVDLRTGKELPHDPRYLFTKAAGCDYHRGAEHPTGSSPWRRARPTRGTGSGCVWARHSLAGSRSMM